MMTGIAKIATQKPAACNSPWGYLAGAMSVILAAQASVFDVFCRSSKSISYGLRTSTAARVYTRRDVIVVDG